MSTFAVVTGGGTAGHVLPALAVAGALEASGHEAGELHYIGCTRGIETRLLPETAYPHTMYDVVGFQRSFSRRNFGFIPKMLRARRAAIALLRDLRPMVVVSVGGYASMPAVFAARTLDIPVVVVSYDRTPGRASRLAARKAAACAVAFENSPLPNATVTGAPVRQEILRLNRAADRTAARERLGIPLDRFLVAVMGGSLGSGVLNAEIARYVDDRRHDDSVAVRQVAGERFAAEIDELGSVTDGIVHQVVGYEPDMPAVYAAADLLIGRGGASTVHEVAVTGIPSILVPWAGAADDHQTDNVRWLSEVGGAVLMVESDLAGLGDEIDRLGFDESDRDALSAAALARGEVHRSGALAELIERVALTSATS
jgi:UDP-N-acetylglucosamine--N-acetylmuramyl-(pentapeptide) pyrophosphoryl-undecaprenol N-acetylglucosamine transferase